MAGATVNDALVSIGEPKKYQFFILFWSILAGAMTAMQSLVLNFTQANMSFRYVVVSVTIMVYDFWRSVT